MATPYNHKEIERKWRDNWKKNPVNVDDGKKPKYYCLDMFPYPSGSGLHVGHWRGYVISDVWSRYKMLQGYYLIHPMGWDAFGLPAENYAIKMGVHPKKSTAENVSNIKRQINEISAIYDWDMEVNTTDPEFYKWTQWIFVKMFKEGLAYEKEMPINWCPSCKTGLANEEVVNGCCERCGAQVTKKNLKQWMLKITKYADRLLEDLKDLDWPEKVKKMQTDWIGKSYGAEVDFKVDGKSDVITVYTTRPDTLYGATFMVLAPEHELAKSLATEENKALVEDYIYKASMKSSVDRLQDKEKTGVFTGSYAINPLNNEKIPIWLSDYVLADYGTGAIMCVPAHDDRDFEFATKFGIPIIQVIAKDGKEIENMTEAYTEASGTMINSGEWNGMESSVLKKEAPEMIEKKGFGRKTVNYKLRDWVFSRQRYWGEPIPIVHCPKCGAVPVPEEELPLLLPEVESYQPTGTGESPLADIEEWVNTTCPCCGAPAKRETNTMPQWVYDDPANLFVAKFLGTPPINVFTGKIENEMLYIGEEAVLEVKGIEDQEVYIGVRPEGFILEAEGKLTCAVTGVDVMGRDVSVVSTNPASLNPVVRSIISSDEMGNIGTEVKFSLKEHKVFIFNKETEERVYFGKQVAAHEEMVERMKAEGHTIREHNGPLPREADDKVQESRPVEEKKGFFAKLKGLFSKGKKKAPAEETPVEEAPVEAEAPVEEAQTPAETAEVPQETASTSDAEAPSEQAAEAPGNTESEAKE